MVPRVRRSNRSAGRPKAGDVEGCRDLHHQATEGEEQVDEWQIAIEHLIRAAETGGGWLMLARIGILRALNRNVERVFNPDRKDHHWGKRKLKRDE
jgi:hypothetical protein